MNNCNLTTCRYNADGKLMHRDKIAYANGDFVSLKDYKALERKAEKLKYELDKTYNQLMEVEKDAQERIAELESELEVKDNLLKSRMDCANRQ